MGFAFACATHGGIFGEPDQHKLRQHLHGDLVLDQRDLMHRRGRLDGNESYQRHACGIADKHHDLHADLHWGRRYVVSSQYDGGCHYRRGVWVWDGVWVWNCFGIWVCVRVWNCFGIWVWVGIYINSNTNSC